MINKKNRFAKKKKPRKEPRRRPKLRDIKVPAPAPAASKPVVVTDQQVALAAQEIKFARLLAGNDVHVRNRALKRLRKWLNLRSQGSMPFTDADFLRLWKGLFYCMWMSDKPLVQEQLAEDLAALVHCFPDVLVGLQFFAAFLRTMCREWFGLDAWRMDKFMMLVRRCFRQALVAVKRVEWGATAVERLGECLKETVFNEATAPVGLIMHLNDLVVEEVAKVAEGEMEPEQFHRLLEPFVYFMAKAKDMRLIKHTKRAIFWKLLMQSELGQEYQEKYEIWKRANFPTSSIDELEVEVQPASDEEEESGEEVENGEEETALDVRAGRVSVILHEIKFDAAKVIELFEEYRYKEFTNAKSRKTIKEIISKYRSFAQGEFPLGTQKMPSVKDVLKDVEPFDPDEKAQEMLDYAEKLALKTVTVPRKIRNKLEWKKKRLLDEATPSTSNGWNEEDVDENKSPTEVEKPPKKTPDKAKKRKSNALEENLDANKTPSKKQKSPKKQKTNESSLFSTDTSWTESTQEEGEDSTPSKLVLNPFAPPASSSGGKNKLKGKNKDSLRKSLLASSISSAEKRVKIVLNRNTAQEIPEYIEQVKNSPQVPHDPEKKPQKGLLKPNLTPSPINPWYKKRIGLKFNDTL